ncbi:MAG TPA: ABC transporter permease [Terriglobia bacterium]
MSLLDWIFRRRRERELEEEIRSHLEMAARDRMESGESGDEARQAVQREFGNALLVKEVTREMWGWGWAERLLQDVRYTLRQLRKNSSFAALAIIMLALGIGANTAMFTVIDSVLIQPLPFRDAKRLVSIKIGYLDSHFGDPDQNPVSWSTYRELRTRSLSFEDIIGIGAWDWTVIQTPQGGQKVGRATITPSGLDGLAVHPVLGRAFDSKDYQSGAAPVVLLSAKLWRDHFGSDPQILRRQVRIGGAPYTVVGVLPDSLLDLLVLQAEVVTSGVWLPSRADEDFDLAGILRPGVSRQAAQAELGTFALDVCNQNQECAKSAKFIVEPCRDVMTGAVRPALLALAGALVLVLLIACVNVSNLQLARHQVRRQELAVRAAIGAGRGRLVSQLMAEGAVLAIAGTVTGLGFASVLLAAVHRLPPNFIPRADEIELRVPVFAMLAVIAAIATILSSLAPALLATRSAPEEALREASGGSITGRKRLRLSQWMVAGEVALSAVLLVSAGLMFHTLYNLEHIHFGFDLQQVTTFAATPANAPGYFGWLAARSSGTAPQAQSVVTRVYQPVLDRLRQLPGVVDVALGSWTPFDGETGFAMIRPPGVPESQQHGLIAAQICYVSPDYARAMGVPLIKGRMISDEDTAGSPLVAVVNETLARRLAPGQDPIGEQIAYPAHSSPTMKNNYTIVGVLGDARQHIVTRAPDPEVLLAYQQVPTSDPRYFFFASGTNYFVRTRGHQELTNAIRQIFRQLAPGYAVDHFRSLQVALDDATFNQRLGLYLTGSFAGVAILMVLTGLYGVLSQLVGQRRREIGVRMALGATNRSILRMILRQGSILALAGLALGLLAALAAGRLLRAFLYGVKPLDAATYVAVAVALLALSIAAALLPARRASRIDPMAALRSE